LSNSGAGGTVGSELIRQLQAKSIPFYAGYHSAEKVAAASKRGIEAVKIDFKQPANLQAELVGCEKLFLLGPNTVDQEDLELNALDAAKSAGVKHIVKQSILHAQDEAYNMARMHRAVEKSIEASGTAWTFLRPNSFMQNTVTFMGDTIRGENTFYTSSGDAGVSIVDVKDIAAVRVFQLRDEPPGGIAKRQGAVCNATRRRSRGEVARPHAAREHGSLEKPGRRQLRVRARRFMVLERRRPRLPQRAPGNDIDAEAIDQGVPQHVQGIGHERGR
jgi:nucleoside-diphosphate-sugar epimerase